MRLTNVAQMILPAGRLHTYATEITADFGAELPISFDQGRHVALGDRAGSWMAVALRLPSAVPHSDLATAWHAVISRHGTLQTAFTNEPNGDVSLNRVEVSHGVWREYPVASGRATRDVLRDVLDEACSPFSRPSHLLCLVEPEADDRPVVVIGSDHSHVDMWSLLIIVRDLMSALASVHDGEDPTLAPAATFAEHTTVLERMPPAPAEIGARWDRILDAGDGLMPVFPLPLGDVSVPQAEVVEVRDVLDSAEVRVFEAEAAAAGVRPTALALSVLTQVTRDMSGQPLRAVFPVHSRHEARWLDAVGWFITNAVIECVEASPKACAGAVKDALALGSYPLAPIFAPYGGMPQGPGMFAISWLDTRRLPEVAPDLGIQYVSASIRTDGVMIWFIVNDSGLHLRCRYPETPEARTNVGGWLDRIEHALRAAVAPESS
ncbi:hypothetical protein FHX49_001291 [Microbacterium endophyticum]|uniref:Condensation domain-containing protein n=1 Tax=Microbacterium endophyticum TaxID=1526412 RepID=A0A7W4V3A1_9MICO|nr:condensation domain-containing protein [Microbacterium endophyticum]MBB2975724.1 hypothetical protein [Microbacterium endophyticum]NIK36207.1 hypothetical protein [Microbacterium endophyticum]